MAWKHRFNKEHKGHLCHKCKKEVKGQYVWGCSPTGCTGFVWHQRCFPQEYIRKGNRVSLINNFTDRKLIKMLSQ